MEVDQRCRIILKNYFYLVCERYGIPIPEGAEWNFPRLPANVPWLIAVEVPRMLMELGEMNEDTRISSMMQLCEYFSEHVNESNCLNMYSSTMTIMLKRARDSSQGELQVFCAFSAAYCIYLHKHNVNEDTVKEVYITALNIFQGRFKWWLGCEQGWETFLSTGRRVLRDKQIADYRVSLVQNVIRTSALFTIVTAGLAIIIVVSLKKK